MASLKEKMRLCVVVLIACCAVASCALYEDFDDIEQTENIGWNRNRQTITAGTIPSYHKFRWGIMKSIPGQESAPVGGTYYKNDLQFVPNFYNEKKRYFFIDEESPEDKFDIYTGRFRSPFTPASRTRIHLLDANKDVSYNPFRYCNTVSSWNSLACPKPAPKPLKDVIMITKTNVFEGKKKVCYNYLGCFDMESPWKTQSRPAPAPESPEKIAASIKFYSRQNPKKDVVITLYPKTNMDGSEFDPEKPTAIIIHGFMQSGSDDWLKEMKDAYLEQVDSNVMVVDWGNASQTFDYLQAVGNTRLVARQLAIFVHELIKDRGADPRKFHLIGHSLGAHICSYLAKSVRGFKRLTALDPAQPAFEGFGEQVGLRYSDADFVDVIHTDALPFIPMLGFGMTMPVGDVDFYVNGGFHQPGCPIKGNQLLLQGASLEDVAKFAVEGVNDKLACSHRRANDYFIEAIRKRGLCTFWGKEMSLENFSKVVMYKLNILDLSIKNFFSSQNCTLDVCAPMGLDAEKSPLRGSFLVLTETQSPYCLN